MKMCLMIASVVAFGLASVVSSEAADAPQETRIAIKGMHCPACAKKVRLKLKAMTRVKSAQVDPKTGVATVVAAEGKELSPRALWEAVEKAGYQPTELTGPSGEFKEKPTE